MATIKIKDGGSCLLVSDCRVITAHADAEDLIIELITFLLYTDVVRGYFKVAVAFSLLKEEGVDCVSSRHFLI